MPTPVDRIPSVDVMKSILIDLEELLGRTGPMAQPGFEAAFQNREGWAESENLLIYMHLVGLEAILTCPPHYIAQAGGYSTKISGWSPPVDGALARARAVVARLMGEWGLTRYADMGPYPGNCGGDAGNKCDFAITISTEDHIALSWVFRVLNAAFDATTTPSEEPDSPKDPIESSQSVFSEAYPYADRGGVMDKAKSDGVFSSCEKSSKGYRYVLADSREHARIKTEVERIKNEQRNRRRKRGKA